MVRVAMAINVKGHFDRFTMATRTTIIVMIAPSMDETVMMVKAIMSKVWIYCCAHDSWAGPWLKSPSNLEASARPVPPYHWPCGPTAAAIPASFGKPVGVLAATSVSRSVCFAPIGEDSATARSLGQRFLGCTRPASTRNSRRKSRSPSSCAALVRELEYTDFAVSRNSEDLIDLTDSAMAATLIHAADLPPTLLDPSHSVAPPLEGRRRDLQATAPPMSGTAPSISAPAAAAVPTAAVAAPCQKGSSWQAHRGVRRPKHSDAAALPHRRRRHREVR